MSLGQNQNYNKIYPNDINQNITQFQGICISTYNQKLENKEDVKECAREGLELGGDQRIKNQNFALLLG